MGCNCKVNSKILKINKKYGFSINPNIKERIEFNIVEFIKLLLLTVIVIVFLPLVLIVVIVLAYTWNGKIDINKIFDLILRKKRK